METATATITIDGEVKDLKLENGMPFNQIMETINNSVNSPGMAITRVSLNGEDITGENWERFAHLKFEDIDLLDIKTGNVESLALETLQSLQGFINDLMRELKRTSGFFRLGDYMQGGELFAKTLDGIQPVSYTHLTLPTN